MPRLFKSTCNDCSAMLMEREQFCRKCGSSCDRNDQHHVLVHHVP